MPSFLNSNGSFFPPQAPQMVTNPASGSTVRIARGQGGVQISTPGIAALTVVLPPNPLPGAIVSITALAAITALTVQSGTAQPPLGWTSGSTLAPLSPLIFQYVGGPLGAWAALTGAPAPAGADSSTTLPAASPVASDDPSTRPAREA